MIPTVIDALQRVTHPRFFETERGFQGAFQAILAAALANGELQGAIVEEEYQKRLRPHGIRRRPDVIVHVPTLPGGDRRRGNFAVFALKLAAGPAKARQDFAALDAVFAALRYRFGAFVNIASQHTRAVAYRGRFRHRMHFFAVWRENERTRVKHAYYDGGRLVEEG